MPSSNTPSGQSPEPHPRTKTVQRTSTFYKEDLDRIENAERFVRSSGRKSETALTMRTLLHRADLDARFLELYDELRAKDPRRQKRKPKT